MPRDAVFSALAGLLVFLLAGAAEVSAVRLFGVDPQELDWVSDAILSASFATAVFLRKRLQATRNEISRLEREHLVLDTQLAVAADIQRRILPPAPGRAGGCRWAAQLRPAGRVSGDYYDFIELDPDSVLVIVADISGKGIPAALLLSSTRVLLRTMARQSHDPGDILTQLSAATSAEYEGVPYRSARIELGSQEAGAIVTDGVTEAIESSGRAAADVLGSILARRGPGATPESVCQDIMREVERSVGSPSVEVQDDRTVVVFASEAGTV